MLTVPTPRLDYVPLAPGVAPKELPLTVAVGPVSDGETVLRPEHLRGFTLLSYRVGGAADLAEVWDTSSGRWVPEDGAVSPSTEQLAFMDGQPEPWQGIVVAAGPTDATGQPRFAPAVAGYPQYRFRVLFRTDDEVAVSGESDGVSFGSVSDRNLMVLGPGEGEQPDSATEARLLLKDPGLSVVGGLVVRRAGSSAEVTLSNATGASVILRPDGGLELRPAPGKGVQVAGDLEAEHVVYRPAGGGSKRTLV